jgi:hypothetical protein
VPERFVGHDRAQVRAADADVDHVADPLPGVPGPLPRPDLVGEGPHPAQHLVHVGHHVLAVHDQLGPGRHPQGHVQHGPVLGHVDVLAAEHGVPALGHPGLLGQLDQQAQGLVGDPVLGVVQVQAGSFGGQPLTPPGILGEEVTQVPPGDLLVVALQRLPRLPLPQRRHGHVSSFVQDRPVPTSRAQCSVTMHSAQS